MKWRIWGSAALALLLSGAGLAQADSLVGEQVRLQIPLGGPPFDATATVIDPGIEFSPYDQISFDIKADNTLTFVTLVGGNWLALDVSLTIVSPGFEFTSVTPITPEPFPFSFVFDSVNHAVVVHSEGGFGPAGLTMTAEFTFASSPNAVPEPSALTLLGLGTLGLLGYSRLRGRRLKEKGDVQISQA